MSNSWTEEIDLAEIKMRKCKSILATREILTDHDLTVRLRKIAKRIDADVLAGKLHTMEEVFGKE